MGESFYQPVCNYLRGWNILEVDLLSSYFITNIMVLNVNVFYSSVIGRVIGKYNRSLIITFERNGGVY